MCQTSFLWILFYPFGFFSNCISSCYAASLSALFKHIGTVEEPSTDELIREKVLSFVRDKVRRLPKAM
jgi:hypothetical protein